MELVQEKVAQLEIQHSEDAFFLADLGDVIKKSEISTMLKLGVKPSRIVFANPCKQTSFIKYAAKGKVDLMTFDNEADQLHQVRSQGQGGPHDLRQRGRAHQDQECLPYCSPAPAHPAACRLQGSV